MQSHRKNDNVSSINVDDVLVTYLSKIFLIKIF